MGSSKSTKSKAKSAGTANIAFIQTFEQPIRFVLRHLAICNSLIDLVTKVRSSCGLDRSQYSLNADTFLLSNIP